MTLSTAIKDFFERHFTRFDLVFLLFLLLYSCLGSLLALVNSLFFHYEHIAYFHVNQLYSLIALFPLFFGAIYLRPHSPNAALVIHTFSCYFIAFPFFAILTNNITSTPFAPIDSYIAAVDHLLHFNSVAVVAWVQHYPKLHAILSQFYNSVIFQLLLTPLAITLLREKKMARHFIILGLIGTLLVSIFYYFFPTIAPAGFYNDPIYSKAQYICAIHFYDIHHSLPITQHGGCLISFPSFHVFIALWMTYLVKNKWWLLIPISIINTIIIASTVLLGWHYLTDVMGGFILFFLCQRITSTIDQWILADQKSQKLLMA